MQQIPEPGTSILINGYPIEIVQIKDNAVKVAKLNPKRRITQKTETE
jgi:Mg2+/Co2+ transporter CorB